MAALGGAASIITIWDLAAKITKFTNSVKDAPDTWQKYRDGLHAVACLERHPHLTTLTIKDRETQCPIAAYVNERLSIVRDDASALLQRYDQMAPKKSKKGQTDSRIQRFFDRLKRTGGSVAFALDVDQIRNLIEAVDRAQSHLHFVLSLVLMQSSESWQQQSAGLLKSILNEVLQSAKSLDELKNDGKRMREAKIEISPTQFRENDVTASSVNSGGPLQAKTGAWMDEKLVRHVGSHLRRAKNSLKGTIRPRVDSEQSHSSTDSTQAIEEANEFYQHEADNEYDSDEQTEKDTASQLSEEHSPCDETTVEVGYVFDEHTCKTFQVPINSEDYALAFSPASNSIDIYSPNSPGTVRADEALDSLSSDEWEGAKSRPIEEVMKLATSAACTAYATDAERISDQSWVSLDFGSGSEIVVAQNILLNSCRTQGSPKLKFCVERIIVLDREQVFYVMLPCWATGGQACDHITMEIEDGQGFPMPLTFRMKLAYLKNISSSHEDELVIGSQNSTLFLFPRCDGGNRRCFHTVAEKGPGQSRCAQRQTLYGSLLELDSIAEDSPDSAEEAASESQSDQEGPGFGLPDQPSPGDDIVAFRLLRKVMLDEGLPENSQIDLNLLLQFVHLMVKYELEFENKPIHQARLWAQYLRPSTPAREDALLQYLVRRKPVSVDSLAWLWIMWKLRLENDFKGLSSTVQRQARCPISSYQPLTKNGLLVKLADDILGIHYNYTISWYVADLDAELLDTKRSAALSRIKGMIESGIESFRQNFQQHKIEPETSFTLSPMASALGYGYLRLEFDRLMMAEASATRDPGFPGTSFNDVYNAIIDLQSLLDHLLTISSPYTRPQPFQISDRILSLLFPSVGLGLLLGKSILERVSVLGRNSDDSLRDTVNAMKKSLSRLIEDLDSQHLGV
ncbi:unnamed protein product [Clonostachys rosea]|uniref:Uncharacterized protein n=1 Tax=Bionectria ochroleuca TaxID=29856 RepID=A0ABY6TRB4_BIOOC|nr:unnamed protein product [Clonostachys rosea]